MYAVYRADCNGLVQRIRAVHTLLHRTRSTILFLHGKCVGAHVATGAATDARNLIHKHLNGVRIPGVEGG
jgi:hypothetical protein